MIRNLLSSSPSGLSLQDTLKLADEHLENARHASTPAKALHLCGSAKAMIKNAELIVTNKRVGGQPLNHDIANAYHKHGKLMEELGQHSKAQKSYSKAEKWGYPYVVSHHTGPSQPPNLNVSNLGSLSPLATLSAASTITVDGSQGILNPKGSPPIPHGDPKETTPDETKDQIPVSNKGTELAPEVILFKDIAPPVAKFTLPEANGRITSTPQLAYCLSLLHHSVVTREGLEKLESDWLQAMERDPDEQRRLRSMAVDVIRAFVRDDIKKSDTVSEVVSLAAVLEQDEIRKLLRVFVDGIDQSLLLKVHFLEGLTYLMENAPPGNFDADDLVRILELLSSRLKGTHQHSTQHAHRLAVTVSRVLDSMVDSQVKGIEREQLHEPLSQYLKDLQRSSDPSLVYQAAYAYQALQYILDDETIIQTTLRRTGKVAKGISGVVSTVKALDFNGFIEGLGHIQEGLKGASEMKSMVSDAYQDAKTLTESGQGLAESLQESLSFTRKSAWYPALRGLDFLLKEGRLMEFEKLIYDTPCRKDQAFQWGVCHRMGELAANTLWDANTRQCAVSFLGEIYSNYMTWGLQAGIKQLVLQILSKLTESPGGDVAVHAKRVFQDLGTNGDSKKHVLYQAFMKESRSSDILIVTSLSPKESRLLDFVQNKSDIETPIRQLKQQRLREQGQDVYISPRAKANANTKEDFDLTSKVHEFLNSDKKVFLVLGNSGAGKSTFNRTLEIELWRRYNKADGRIPLFIHLPSIEKLELDLIAERLRQANFTENQIRELKLHHEIILICDGYDEAQQTRNLYISNRLNQPGEWRAQMVVSCRTEYTDVDYKSCFQPIDQNGRDHLELFQEAIIAPFNKGQIQDYIDQYVTSRTSLWNTGDYRRALEQVPNLQDLVKNPFLLKLALDVLPRLLNTDSVFSAARITRVALYDEFVEQWIERNKIRLRDVELGPRDREAFKILSDSGFCRHGVEYLKELAMAIYDRQGGHPVVNYSERVDHKTWKKTFFDSSDGKNLLREAIPLVQNIDQYWFMHKSILEYGLSLAVYDPSVRDENTEQEPGLSRRGSTSSALSFEAPALIEEPVATEQYLLDSPFGRRSFVHEPSISQFLVERVQQQPAFKEKLLAVIERSKTEKTARIAAANAITVLVRAGVKFIGDDLRGIKIPGSDLSYGMFDSARLDGADLRKAKLRSIWLRKANLSGAEMTGAQFGELPFLQEDDDVRRCAYWHDGKTLAVGLENGGFRLYDTSSWEKIKEFGRNDDWFGYPLFSETSDRVAYVDANYELKLGNIKAGKCFQTLQGHTKYATSVVYSPSGTQVVSGSWDKTVRVWNVETGECIHVLQGHGEVVFSLAYAPNGDQLASASGDRTVRLWNIETGECVHVLQGHSGEVYDVAYSPNGGQIASGSEDSTISLWDIKTVNCIRTLRGHVAEVSHVVYSPNGGQIASGGEDQTIRLWDVESGTCIHTFQGHSDPVYCVAFSPNGNQITSGGVDKTVRVWTVESQHFARVALGHVGYVRCVAYSPNGGQVASGSEDETVRLWDVETGNCVYNLQGHSGMVFGVAYSPKGDQIAFGGQDMTVKLWNVETGNYVHTLEGHSNAVCSVMYSPNGSYIASGSDDQTIRLWDVETGECVHILQGHTEEVYSVAYSLNGDQIASGSQDKTVRLWDVEAGNCICTLQGHDDAVYNIAYSPKGGEIASGGADKTVRLWNIQTGGCIHVLQGHIGHVASVTYSLDGGRIASGGYDRTVWLWDVETGQCLTVISGFNGVVYSVAWKNTLNGEYLVTGSDDRSVRHWEIIKDRDEHRARLCWSSSHDALTAIDASFDDIRGLSQANRALLSQYGAIFTPSPLVL